MQELTISNNSQNGQIHRALPGRPFLQSDAIASGSEDVATANGHYFTALVPTGHVVQHSCVIYEGIKFAGKKKEHRHYGNGTMANGVGKYNESFSCLNTTAMSPKASNES